MTPVTCFIWFEYTLDKSMFCGLYPLCLVMGNSLYPFGLLNVILSPNKEIIIQSNQLLKIKATYFWEIHFILSFTAIYIISFTNDQMPYCLPIISLNGENILKFAHNVRNKLFRYLIHKAKIIWQKIFFFFFEIWRLLPIYSSLKPVLELSETWILLVTKLLLKKGVLQWDFFFYCRYLFRYYIYVFHKLFTTITYKIFPVSIFAKDVL